MTVADKDGGAELQDVFMHSAGYTQERARDWMAFVRDLESDYWSDMHAYVRDTLSFQGLVTGTQLMNSAPSIQQEFPFIDGGGYAAELGHGGPHHARRPL